MKVKSDKSAQIMYITDTKEYKIIVDVGSTIYVFDTPSDATLSDLTDYVDTGDAEKDAIAKAGIYTTDSKTFNAGFYKNDRLVSVPLAVGQITPAIADDAADILGDFFTSTQNLVETYGAATTLWTDDEYLSQIAAISATLDGDVDEAVTQFKGTPAYGDILSRLELSQEMLDAQEMAKTDPIGFQNTKNENKNYLTTIVEASGGSIPEAAIDWLADSVAKGAMSLSEANRQIAGATDPYSLNAQNLNATFKTILEGGEVSVTSAKEKTVQDLLDQYLPSYLHDTVNIAAEAGKIRADADYADVLASKLKKQRYSLYNMYDEDVDWNFIVSSKKQVAKNVLGVELKEDDPVLDSIIRMNDTSKEQEYLREIGLERGYQKTKDDLTRAMMSTFGSGVVQSTAYVEGR